MSSSRHCETAKLKFGVNATPAAPNRHSTGANSAGCSFQQAASDRGGTFSERALPQVPFKDGLRLEVFTVRDSTSSLHDRTPDIIISVLRPVHSVHAEGLATFELGTWLSGKAGLDPRAAALSKCELFENLSGSSYRLARAAE